MNGDNTTSVTRTFKVTRFAALLLQANSETGWSWLFLGPVYSSSAGEEREVAIAKKKSYVLKKLKL